MANIETMQLGQIQSLAQDIVYALPPIMVYVFSDTALQVSNTTDFAATAAITASTATIVCAAFIRCHASGPAVVIIKRT